MVNAIGTIFFLIFGFSENFSFSSHSPICQMDSAQMGRKMERERQAICSVYVGKGKFQPRISRLASQEPMASTVQRA